MAASPGTITATGVPSFSCSAASRSARASTAAPVTSNRRSVRSRWKEDVPLNSARRRARRESSRWVNRGRLWREVSADRPRGQLRRFQQDANLAPLVVLPEVGDLVADGVLGPKILLDVVILGLQILRRRGGHEAAGLAGQVFHPVQLLGLR